MLYEVITLSELSVGDYILDFVGPLGVATHFDENIKKAAVVGGGVGCAIAYPQAKMLFSKGVDVITSYSIHYTKLYESQQ